MRKTDFFSDPIPEWVPRVDVTYADQLVVLDESGRRRLWMNLVGA